MTNKLVYGIGFNGSSTKYGMKCYKGWKCMIMRCYDRKFLLKRLTYKGCTVCNEWHDFENFAKWYIENYYEIEGERLDKDILFIGNKVYSPDTCIFLPHSLNLLTIANDRVRGKYLKGASCNNRNKFRAQVRFNSKSINLGDYKTEVEANEKYLEAKKHYALLTVQQYKYKIPEPHYTRIYEAFQKYDFSIELHKQEVKND